MLTTTLLKLAVGFLLTTVCGGLLGYIFQRRHARYQWVRSRWEKELDEAQGVFEEVSRILDRRLYRTRQLLWALGRKPESYEKQLAEYRIVVTEWNDNINRILALLTIHFGEDIRDDIDYRVGTEFVAIGRQLERAIRGESQLDAEQLEKRLNDLAGQIYGFNLRLLKVIQTKRRTLVENA